MAQRFSPVTQDPEVYPHAVQVSQIARHDLEAFYVGTIQARRLADKIAMMSREKRMIERHLADIMMMNPIADDDRM
jgi:hypothetical protein